ncbi:MAG: HEAT repeat domain-containing protein [Alphaproteobacteria bacterium]|nr:MAG: HEAT repeat domain-containing protein [Alphaproteobacteria bacterium]
MTFDIAEEPETLTIKGGDLEAVAKRYLTPRINGGTYAAEDGIFRGPYQSVFVVHPVGGESRTTFEVQGAQVDLLGLPDVEGAEADGILALDLARRWQEHVRLRSATAGLLKQIRTPSALDPMAYVPSGDWSPILAGADAPTAARLKLLTAVEAASESPSLPALQKTTFRGSDTQLQFAKDPERGEVLTMGEVGAFRTGGFALPTPKNGPAIPSTETTPTFAFWMKSEAQDSIVVQFHGDGEAKSVAVGRDVPFAYDNKWHRVKIDLRPLKKVSWIAVAPDSAAQASLRQTLGPIVASLSDFEATTETPDSKPTLEAPSATATTPEARAAWAAAAGPGEQRRALFKDPNEAVRANAVAAAFAREDKADESALIEAALYNYDPSVFGPALRILGKAKTPTAQEALQRAMRGAASDRARGLAAEILAESHDSKLVALILPLNQARSRAARLSAVRALGSIPGEESALMRMAFLPQNDPEIKLATTLTADANDDYQGRKLLWSAVNEPSDAVRLESLRRLSYSSIKEFQAEGLKGVRDDSVGVRIGLLQAWAERPQKEHLPGIKIALNDRSPRVRAAALEALAKNPEPVDPNDLQAAFADPDPQVGLAALRLTKAKNIAPPVETLDRWRMSPDPKLRQAAGA